MAGAAVMAIRSRERTRTVSVTLAEEPVNATEPTAEGHHPRTWPPLEFRVTVPAPRPEVWRAFTDPALLVRWLAREASSDRHVLCLGWPGGTMRCRVVQRDREQKLRFSWPDPSGMFPETFVVVGLQADGDRTLVDLEHYGFGRGDDWDDLYVGVARAWSGYLKNLRSLFSGGPDLRENDE